jgi:hypothetical protein
MLAVKVRGRLANYISVSDNLLTLVRSYWNPARFSPDPASVADSSVGRRLPNPLRPEVDWLASILNEVSKL